jgi:hypothetical protein
MMLQAATMPTKRPPAPPLMPPRAARQIAGLEVCLCQECLRPFAKKRIDQKFCGQSCRRKSNARIEARRTELYAAGMAMRAKKKGGFSALTNLLDSYIREDRRRDEAYAAACAEKGVEA